MTAFESHDIKAGHLKVFHKTALGDSTWCMDGVGEGDERRLLQEFQKCHSVFAALRPESRVVIMDITERMANGMAEFVDKDLGQGTENVKEYNRYCHFVAGLVGEGLSRLFAASGLEKKSVGDELYLSDQMGLFLQKTNIIRDYLEDYVDGRAFWPQSVWKKYSKSGDLGYFSLAGDGDENKAAALKCLNELVTDALELVPDCLAYLSKLECAEIYRFCAIPQVMAIATLDKCFNNPDVFTGVVKIRKGLSCKLILNTNDITGVHGTFYSFARSIAVRANPADPSYERTMTACGVIQKLTAQAGAGAGKLNVMPIAAVTLAVSGLYLKRHIMDDSNSADGASLLSSAPDIIAAFVFIASMVYLVVFPAIFGGAAGDQTLQSARDMEKLKKE